MSFLKQYLDYTSPQEATTRVHTWVGISIIAAALERKVWMNRQLYTLFPNLYTFIVGPSGVVRKSTSAALGVDLLRDLEGLNILSDRMTASSLIQQIAATEGRYSYNGKELRQCACYIYASELSVMLKEVYGSLPELLTTFYDCVPNDCSKPWVYTSVVHGDMNIYGPCLNILAASTPTWLADCLPQKEMEGGFGSRIIIVVEDTSKHYNALLGEDDGGKATSDTEAKKRLLAADLKRIHSLTGPMVPDKEMRLEGQKWYVDYRKATQTNNDQRFSGYFGRKFDTVLKVAMCLSVAESDDLVMKWRHFEEALALLSDVEKRMFNAFGAIGENPNSALTDKIWKILLQYKYIPLSKLTAFTRRDASAERTLLVLRDLEIMQRARRTHDQERKDIFYSAINPDQPL